MNKAILCLSVPVIALTGCGDKAPPDEPESGGFPVTAAVEQDADPPTPVSPVAIAADPPRPPPSSDRDVAVDVGRGAVLPDAPQPAPKTAHIPGGFPESRATLEKFLAAADWRERLPFIYESDRLRNRIESDESNRPGGPIENFHLKFMTMDETPSDEDYPLYVFTLQFSDEERTNFPVTVRKTPEGMKIDWEIFVEFRDRKFRRFVESGAAGPETLRVILKRQSYWGKDRDAMAAHPAFQLTTMDPEVELTAFVPEFSPLVETMNEFYHWGVGSIAATVEVERRKFPHGESHFVITRLATHPLASDGWHLRSAAD